MSKGSYPRACDKEISAAKQHLLYPAFDEWVVESGQVYHNTKDRLAAWKAFLGGYTLRASDKNGAAKKVKAS